jgi:hypothetical protein
MLDRTRTLLACFWHGNIRADHRKFEASMDRLHYLLDGTETTDSCHSCRQGIVMADGRWARRSPDRPWHCLQAADGQHEPVGA